MKIEELVFIRDKEDLVKSLTIIRNKNKTIFICLTFEAFLESKLNKLNYIHPYKLNGMSKVNFLNEGKKQALFFIKKNTKKITKDDLNYLTSRFIIFFSQIIFDKNLIFILIKLYNPKSVILFNEKIESVINKGWYINRSFYYYQTIIQEFFPQILLKLYDSKNYKYNRLTTKILNIIKIGTIISNLKNSLKIFLYKNLIIIEGFRNDKFLKNEFIKSIDKKKYNIVTDFKNSAYIRLLYFFLKKKRLYKIKNNQYKKKIFDLEYSNLKIEIDTMISFMSNYFSFQNFLVSKMKKKKIFFGIFQEKYETNIALKKAKIKTFQLPHGAIITPELSPMVGTYNFFPNLNQKIYHQESKMLSGKSYISGVPHLHTNLASKQKNFNRIIIFMKNMGMRRWEFDDYEKILDIINFILNYAQKNNHQIILKFHPSGGKHQYLYLKDSKYFKTKKIKLLLNYDTDKLIRENEIFICLQETSVINQIVELNKNIIFPFMHLNKNYLNNHIFHQIKKNCLIPKNLKQIGKYIDEIKKGNLLKSYDKSNFKTYFGTYSIKRINNFIYQKKFI